MIVPFPPPLESYPTAAGAGLSEALRQRVALVPFNLVATLIFLLAILHTFAAPRFARLAERWEPEPGEPGKERGEPNLGAEVLHFLGEIEIVFGLWAVVLVGAIALFYDWPTAREYLTHTVEYTEAVFVIVIMALASSRPILDLAGSGLDALARLGGGTPLASWLAILTVGPLLGSFITEPAAMTISALLLGRRFYDLRPRPRLAYATLGLLFVNVSVGGTLSHFAAPPVLMVARRWGWDLGFMLARFGGKAALGIVVSNLVYLALFRRELAALRRPSAPAGAEAGGPPPVPRWVILVHVGFMAWTVLNAHYPVLFIGGFLFFLGFAKATSYYQSPLDLRPPLLVGFFLAGLVIHGGLQGWWIAPLLASFTRVPLFLGATVLTAFNDNALIAYLATLVPGLTDALKYAVVAGAVTGGGLTVIANAPNPAGQAILGRYFGGAVSPLGLAAGALLPTLILGLSFLML